MFELKKIGIIKRASALLLDLILLAVLATGFMFLISLICKYDYERKLGIQYYTEWDDYRKAYAQGVSEAYGFTYVALDDENADYQIKDEQGNVVKLDAVWAQLQSTDGKSDYAITSEAWAKFQELTPVTTVNAQYKYVYSLLFTMISLGILLSYIVLEFIIPIILKNGQTVGKKVFGICLVRPDCVKISTLSLFARAILGKYAIETMFPVLLVFMFFFGGLGILAIILLAALALLNLILFFTLKNRTPIHDLVAGTVVADMKLQMIYQSEEELAEQKAKDFIGKAKS